MKNKFWFFVVITSSFYLVIACTNDQLTQEEIIEVEEVIDFRDDLVGTYKMICTERQYLPPTDPSLPNPYPIDTTDIDKIIQVENPIDYPLSDDGERGRLLVNGILMYASIDSTGKVELGASAGNWAESYFGTIVLPDLYYTWNDMHDGIRWTCSGEKQ